MIDLKQILKTGLCGKLTMKNCDFDGLGDDALNVHSSTVVDAENGIIKCNYCKKDRMGFYPRPM